MTKERRLGRGLAALLGNPADELPQDSVASDPPPEISIESALEDTGEEPRYGGRRNADTVLLSVYEIDDNPFQPRRDFSEPEIVSLAESLKEHDMLQPLLVRRMGDRYQLISGERRLRAATRAGWSHVPARIREADDRLVAELAIVENLQRKDLNPIEKALSFKRYIDEHQCTQDDLAKRIKVDRSTIANLMRLLELPEPVQQDLMNGRITAGHARALLPLGDEIQQIAFCDRIKDQHLSVRATEDQVADKIAHEDQEPLSVVGSKPTRRRKQRSDQVAALETELRVAMGTKVDIKEGTRGRGKIVIHFTSLAEFDRIRQHLAQGNEPQEAAG